MSFFSEQSDALLCDWLTSSTWHIDKPSENAKFYRFAAMLMQEAGQPDIREVRCTLQEAAQRWATDYTARGGDVRIASLCEHLQVLYDFFGAVHSPAPPQAEHPQPQPLLLNPPDTSMPLQKISSVAVAPALVLQAKLAKESAPSILQDTPRLPKQRNVRKKTEVQQEHSEVTEIQQEHSEVDASYSSERWKQFWPEVVRLHTLLLERRGEPPPPRIAADDPKAIHAEMGRWAEEVLKATEVTGAEKRDLIGRVIEKVILPDQRIEGSTITIKWLK